jgi:hypothetical protein
MHSSFSISPILGTTEFCRKQMTSYHPRLIEIMQLGAKVNDQIAPNLYNDDNRMFGIIHFYRTGTRVITVTRKVTKVPFCSLTNV